MQKLKQLKLQSAVVLLEKEMKAVRGGSGGSGCSISMTCPSGTQISCHGTHCSYERGVLVRCSGGSGGTTVRCSGG